MLVMDRYSTDEKMSRLNEPFFCRVNGHLAHKCVLWLDPVMTTSENDSPIYNLSPEKFIFTSPASPLITALGVPHNGSSRCPEVIHTFLHVKNPTAEAKTTDGR